MMFYFTNNTFVATGGGTTSGGVFDLKYGTELDIVGTGKGQNSVQFVITAQATQDKLSEIVTILVSGVTINSYATLHAVSKDVWNVLASHGGSNPTTVPAIHIPARNEKRVGTAFATTFPY